MRKDNLSIAINGMGIISSIGSNVTEFGTALKNGICGITKRETPEGFTYPNLGGFIQDFDFEKAIMKYSDAGEEFLNLVRKSGKPVPRMYQMTIAACMEAWFSQKDCEHIAADRRGLVVAGTGLSEEVLFHSFQKKTPFGGLRPGSLLQSMDSYLIGVLSELFGIKGFGTTLGATSASGNAALIQGLNLIRAGVTDWCMVVGPAFLFSPVTLQALNHLGALGGKSFPEEPEKACRPFDTAHEGFVQGEAAACIILKRTEAGTKDIVISGSKFLLHGSKSTEPDRETEKMVMAKAMEEAEVSIQELDYINAHATSTPAGDIAEMEAIHSLFGSFGSSLAVNSTKSLTGHCMYSAGIVETIATVIQMKEGFLHPNLNLDNPVTDKVRFIKKLAIEADIHRAINNSFGFFGINTSIVLEKRT